MADATVRVQRHHYVHIFDSTTNATRTVCGPALIPLKACESSLFAPRPCICVPPRHYCVIKNPCVRDAKGAVVLEPSGQVKQRLGDTEIRLHGEPFPLYPEEEVVQQDGSDICQLPSIAPNAGLHVRFARDFKDGDRLVVAGTEGVVAGPQTYIPRVEMVVLGGITASIVQPSTALLLQAKVDFTDRHGCRRKAGAKWLERSPGLFLPAAEETILSISTAVVLSERNALQLTATQSFTDVYGKVRRAGERWLVTCQDAPSHIVDVYEEKVADVSAISLNAKEVAIIHNPVDATGRNRYGDSIVRRGECTFFLHSGEEMPRGVERVLGVGKGDALLVEALCEHDEGPMKRLPGSRWMVRGPCEFVPTNLLRVLEHRHTIPLDQNEGIYVMNTTTGVVRAVIGESYLLDVDEVLWEKRLPPAVEELLESPNGSIRTNKRNPNFRSHRERHRIVRFNVQHNAAVQIYDYHRHQPRIVLGPNLVMLAPHEEFTVLSLSGGTPKVPNALQSLQLFLGPRFSNDTIVVETSDHAHLRLRLSYNWQFDIDRTRPSQKTFSVPDFIGDCCKTIASRVRGAVAAEDFDTLHRNSATIIRAAVFGVDEAGDVGTQLRFSANNFVVTNIDVQSVEPTDAKTRDSLQKSVQLAIEITTKSQEAAARHGNELKDQEARGRLERLKLVDKIEVENARMKWLELQAKSEAVQASGQSVAEAKARAEALRIEAESELQQAELRAKAYRISAEVELQKLQERQAVELEYSERQNKMDIAKVRAAAEAEVEKVKRMVDAIGRETLVAMARAGPDTQAKLLASLGLKGYLITDGRTPVNLFGTLQGLVNESKT